MLTLTKKAVARRDAVITDGLKARTSDTSVEVKLDRMFVLLSRRPTIRSNMSKARFRIHVVVPLPFQLKSALVERRELDSGRGWTCERYAMRTCIELFVFLLFVFCFANKVSGSWFFNGTDLQSLSVHTALVLAAPLQRLDFFRSPGATTSVLAPSSDARSPVRSVLLLLVRHLLLLAWHLLLLASLLLVRPGAPFVASCYY